MVEGSPPFQLAAGAPTSKSFPPKPEQVDLNSRYHPTCVTESCTSLPLLILRLPWLCLAALLLMSLGTQAPRHTDASVSMMNIRPYLIFKTLQEIIPKVTLLYHYSPTNGEQRNR
jgi:hypothetical protein